jgi:hypothetical protein
VVGLRRDEVDALGEAELVDERHHLLDLGVAVLTAGAADDDKGRVRAVERGEGAHGDVDALERLDPPDEQQHRLGPQAEAQRTAGSHAVTRGEERVLHARRHDLDPARRVAVVPAELPFSRCS